jgi:septum formation protein
VRLVLASASPARRSVLRAAGIDPIVRVSGVDEDAIAAALPDPSHEDIVTTLALAKADAVLPHITTEQPDAVIVGCDSMLIAPGADGADEIVGKPATATIARQRWHRMAGGTGTLITGHAVIRLQDGAETARVTGAERTVVRFDTPTEAELDAYLASGEPFEVAGAFTLDGLGGWFIAGVDGDPSSVIGISLPLTRRLLTKVGVSVVDLWNTPATRVQSS